MKSQQASYSSMAFGGGASLILIVMSFATVTYLTSAYAGIALVQLLMFAVLTDAYIPEYTREYLQDMNFALLSSEDANFYKGTYGRMLENSVNRAQDDEQYDLVGVFSESAIVVNYLFFFAMGIVVTLHILMRLYIGTCVDKDDVHHW